MKNTYIWIVEEISYDEDVFADPQVNIAFKIYHDAIEYAAKIEKKRSNVSTRVLRIELAESHLTFYKKLV